MLQKIDKVDCSKSATIIFDLFSNSSYRFEQFDGTLSLPYKTNGKYQLARNIVACP
jgi:hypothetical protein